MAWVVDLDTNTIFAALIAFHAAAVVISNDVRARCHDFHRLEEFTFTIRPEAVAEVRCGGTVLEEVCPRVGPSGHAERDTNSLPGGIAERKWPQENR